MHQHDGAATAPTFEDVSIETARALDAADGLAPFRDRFSIPRRADGEPVIYLTGNSLGLMPRATRSMVDDELEAWATLAVDGHFKDDGPWYSYHELVRDPLARLVGAKSTEVVAMNGLTVNLHLLMVSLFRPTATRYRILMESPAFPSDIYAIRSHLRTRGLDPDDALITVGPRDGEHLIRDEDLAGAIEAHGESIALVLLGGVNFFTGQVLDMEGLTALGHEHGCLVGFDLAHAAGNVPLHLHDWGVDFAAWCSYKYLNSGPGAIAGAYVHERHAADRSLPRYGGWWGNDPDTRFRMHLENEFVPVPTADAWQCSNPPILAMAPLRVSLELYEEAGLEALRRKSVRLTGLMRACIERHAARGFEIVTPASPDRCGCQLSLLVHDQPRERFGRLEAEGVVCDFREPNVVRAAPVPLYNTFEEVHRFAEVLTRTLAV